jgi:hypothetical protein
MKLLRVFWIVVASAAFGLTQQPGYALIWKPRVGQEFKYRVDVDAQIAASKLAFGAELQLRVAKVAANGDYTVESVYSHATMIVDGTSMDIADAAKSTPEIEVFNSKGMMISKKKVSDDDEWDPFSRALNMMMDFHAPEKPVKVGDKWSKEIKGDATAKIRPVKIEYAVAATERLGAAEVVKVVFSYEETERDKPVTGDGTFLLDAADGSLHRLDATVVNLRFDESTPVERTRVRVARK